jgi:DNA phosphorothioation-dependent restriction protein DptG
VTPPGIDPGTVRLVAQRLNHYDTPDPNRTKYKPNFANFMGQDVHFLTKSVHYLLVNKR